MNIIKKGLELGMRSLIKEDEKPAETGSTFKKGVELAAYLDTFYQVKAPPKKPAAKRAELSPEEQDFKKLKALGWKCYEKQDHQGAVDTFTQIITLYPDDGESYMYRGASNFKLGEYEAAIADCARAISLKPAIPMPYNWYVRACLQLRQYDRALEGCNQALAAFPTWDQGFLIRGHAHSYKGSHDKAIADYTEAIRLKVYPKGVDGYIGRALTYLTLGDNAKAKADFEEALRLEPSNRSAQENLSKLP